MSVLFSEPADGLLLRLPFDGNCAPAVGGDAGAPELHGSLSYPLGVKGKAVSLTGGSYLVVPLPASVKEGDFSITFWMKPLWHSKDGLPHPILDIPPVPKTADAIGWAPRQIFVSKGWSETISPDHFYGVADPGVGLLHLKPGRWTHVALIYSSKGKYTATYFDGEGGRRPFQDKESFNINQARAWLGSRASGKGGGDILMDDFRVYGRALSAGEIPGIAGRKFPPPRDYLLLGNSFDPVKAEETDHIRWAKPFAGGRLNVLCISEGKRARDFIELAQRIDVQPIVFSLPSLSKHSVANTDSFFAIGKQIEGRLSEGGIDGVLFASAGWNLLPDSTRSAIMETVKNGAGLLLVGPLCVGGPGIISYFGNSLMVGWEQTPAGRKIEKLIGRLPRVHEEFLTRGVPWKALVGYRSELKVQAPETFYRGGKVGKGRILLFDIYNGAANSRSALTPSYMYDSEAVFDAFDYDYELSAAAKALLWACGRDSGVRITELRFVNWRQPRPPYAVGASGAWVLRVLNRSDRPVRARIELAVRSRSPAPPAVTARDVSLPAGETRVELPMNLGFIGETFGDAKLLIDGKTADWASSVTTTQHGNPWFRSLACDRPKYGNAESPAITAETVLKTYGVSFGEKGEIRWQLFDAFGRLVKQGIQSFEFNPYDQAIRKVQWRLPPLDSASLHYELVAGLFRKGRLYDQRSITLHRVRQADDYVFTLWGNAGRSAADSLATLVMRDKYHAGCTAINASGQPLTPRVRAMLAWVNRANLQPWVYAFHLGGKPDKNNVRSPDMFDPAFVESLQNAMTEIVRVAEPYSPLYYSLGDEVKLGPPRAAASAYEKTAFLAFLKAKYGTVEKLNRAWGTEYGDWSSIAVFTRDEMKTKVHPLINELIGFRQKRLARLCGIGTETALKRSLSARVGIEGVFGLRHAWGGYDYPALAGQSSFLGLYAHDFELEMARSFLRPGALFGIWWNYAKLDPGYSRFGPWHHLLHGGNTFMWYTTLEGSQYTALNPDFSPSQQFRWTFEELEPLLNGIGKLVVGLERDDLGLRILYEQRNLDRHSPAFLSLQNLVLALEDLGIQYSFISSRQVAGGKLRVPEVKALILPGQFSMAPPVAKAVRDYVIAGGNVLADIYPGESNGYRRYKKRPLDDLFAPRSGLKAKLLPHSEADLKAWAGHEKRFQQGRTLLLGNYVSQYRRERYGAGGLFFRKLAAAFLAKCRVLPRFRIVAAGGKLEPKYAVSYHDGAASYLGLQRDYRTANAAPVTYEVAASSHAHVYDARTGAYLGYADRAQVTLEPARSTLLSFLPGRVTGIQVSGLPGEVKQGQSLKLDLRLTNEGGTARHGIFRITVTGPGGQRIPPLCRKVRWSSGTATVPLSIAFNDPPGAYTVHITDIATGVFRKLPLKVGP